MINSIDDLRFDTENANLHTDSGMQALEHSVSKFGIGRGILVDKAGNIIAGNATVETLQKMGYKRVRIVESDGKKLVAVRRKDLDLAIDAKAKGMAFADNRTRELNLLWNEEKITEASHEMALNPFWSDREIESMLVNPENEHEVMKTSPTQGGTFFVVFGKFRILTTQKEFEAIVEKIELYFLNKNTYHGFTTHLIELSRALSPSESQTSEL